MARVVNATTQPVDVRWNAVALTRGLAAAEASPFLPLQPGPGALDVIDPERSTSTTLQLGAAQHLSVLLTQGSDGLRVTPLVHRFAPPRETTIRVRVVHAADSQPLRVELAGLQDELLPGADSGDEGVELPANTSTAITVERGGRQLAFTVPALPAGSELLLVLVQPAPNDLELLGVAPSAALGFFESNGGAP